MKKILVSAVALAALLAVVLLPNFIVSTVAADIRSQSWTLVGMTVDGKAVSLPKDARITLNCIEDDRYSGRAGVNHYTVQLDIDRRGGVTFGHEDGGVTEMAGPSHLMAIEEAYLAAFFRIDTATVSGATLVLEGKGVRLEYEGEPATPIDLGGSPEDAVSVSSDD